MEELRFCQLCSHGLETQLLQGRLRRVCPACARVAYLDPMLVVVAVVLCRDEVVMVRRNVEPGIGAWALPGGHVERGESVEQAVEREVQEETGLTTKISSLVGLYSESKNPVVVAAYTAEFVEGKMNSESSEVQAVGLFSFEDLPRLAFPRDRGIILQVIRARSEFGHAE